MYLIDANAYQTLKRLFQCRELKVSELFDRWRDRFEDLEAPYITGLINISDFLIVEAIVANSNNIDGYTESNPILTKNSAANYLTTGQIISTWIDDARQHPHQIVKALNWWMVQSNAADSQATICLFITDLIAQIAVQACLEVPGNTRILSDLDSTSYLEAYVDTPIDTSEVRSPQQIHAAAWRTGEPLPVGRWIVQRDPAGERLEIRGTTKHDDNGLLFNLGCEFSVTEDGYICSIPHHSAVAIIGALVTA